MATWTSVRRPRSAQADERKSGPERRACQPVADLRRRTFPQVRPEVRR